ncbi:MAG: hypothetical protein JST50_00995 [Bacteroidetes bacterium]|jgi:hypothetical protein|nr:hypothetical protein [Bacteroidota bacterium]
MADDIKKTIKIDVQVNSNAQEQLDNIKKGAGAIGEAVGTGVQAGVKEASDQVQKTGNGIFSFFSDGFKKAFSNVIGYYKKAATDGGKSVIAMNKDANKAVETDTKASQDKIRASIIDSTQKTADSIFSIMTKSNDSRRDYDVAKNEKARKAAIAAAGDDKAAVAAINQKYDKLENAAKNKAFKADQNAARAQAIINGAIAITKAEATLGPIAGTIAIGVIAAQTAAQLAIISKQQPPALAKGGYFKSDGKGAVLPGYSRTDNTNAYLRSGEAVVVSEAMRDPWARNLVSAINVAFGGRDFSVPNLSRGYAVGGIFTDGGNTNRYYNQPVNDQKNLANTVAYQMINNFPPVYVDVKDINNQQNILAQTINRVNL